jgi:hypothetical protein
MMIQPKFTLVNFIVDGIRATMNSEEARELKQKYPKAKIERLRQGRSSLRADQLPSKVRIVPVDQYLAGF